MRSQTLEIKLYPNAAQEAYLSRLFGCHRKVYNTFLAKAIAEYEKDKSSFASMKAFRLFFHKEFIKMEEFDYMTEHNTKILKDALINLDKAFKNFFKHNFGFPQFKSKNNEQSIGLHREAISKKAFDEAKFMYVSSTFGRIRYRCSKEYKQLIEQHKNEVIRITIKHTRAGEYFAKLLIETELPAPRKSDLRNDKVVGIDMGIKTFLTLSDGTRYENKKFKTEKEKKLADLQRGLSRKIKVKRDKPVNGQEFMVDSKNRTKARRKLAKANEKIARRRKNYIHGVVNDILDKNHVIGIETLAVKQMMESEKFNEVAKGFSDVALGEFTRILEYKAAWRGKEVVKVDQYFPSSKRCPKCMTVNDKLRLEDRTWVCLHCFTLHDRDGAASENVEIETRRLVGSRYPEFTLARQ